VDIRGRGLLRAVGGAVPFRLVASITSQTSQIFFRRALEDDTARGFYVVDDGSNPTVAELTEAAAVAIGARGAVTGSDHEARARLGDYFAEVLLLDQRSDATKARAELGWQPTHPPHVDEFRSGSYRTVTA
jgi:nucleoside-diphosphate-sugar epimerase